MEAKTFSRHQHLPIFSWHFANILKFLDNSWQSEHEWYQVIDYITSSQFGIKWDNIYRFQTILKWIKQKKITEFQNLSPWPNFKTIPWLFIKFPDFPWFSLTFPDQCEKSLFLPEFPWLCQPCLMHLLVISGKFFYNLPTVSSAFLLGVMVSEMIKGTVDNKK